MTKKFLNNRKALTALLAATLVIAIMLSGTFAWQSISQTALNEVSATVNPGARLHDDFKDVTDEGNFATMTYDKDVYVENFTSKTNNGVQVFARIRLDEYMEIGAGAGTLNDQGNAPAGGNEAISLVPGAKLADKSTWLTHVPGNARDPFHEYWQWTTGGSTVFMPTFNRDKNSLDADINGTFAKDFTDHEDYAVGDEKEAETNYGTTTTTETHTAANTLNSAVITMEQWLKAEKKTGNFWVWDEDGWTYWANPIEPDTATGLLLDQIQRTDVTINEDWYYGINVVAQFVTADDLGQDDNSGFFDPSGIAPSDNALLLLNEIGVEVTFEVDSVEELKTAPTHGGIITLNENLVVNEQLTITEDTVLDFGGHTISNTANIWSEENSAWSLFSVSGADTTLTIKGGIFQAKENDCYAVDVRDGAKLVIHGGSFMGNISAVYVHTGSAAIYGGTFSIQQLDKNNPYGYVLNGLDENLANGTAQVTVCGGSYYGFNPSNSNDGNLVPNGYVVSHDNSTGSDIFTVTSTAVQIDAGE